MNTYYENINLYYVYVQLHNQPFTSQHYDSNKGSKIYDYSRSKYIQVLSMLPTFLPI